MTKIKHEDILEAALEIMEKDGLEAITTREIAKKLNVQSASLYWHIKDKETLLNELASLIITRNHKVEIPENRNNWEEWFLRNAINYRNTLMMYPDGALLHAGSIPINNSIELLLPKIEYLMSIGFSKKDAAISLLNMGQFTLGNVIEQQKKEKKRDLNQDVFFKKLGFERDNFEDEAFTSGIVTLIAGLKSKL